MILRGYLEKHVVEARMGPNVFHESILIAPVVVEDDLTPLQWIARNTEGFSGSHLLEVSAQAAKKPVIEAIAALE